MSAAPLRLGVLGCADVAWRAMLPALEGIDAWKLAAVGSRSEEKAARFAKRFGCEGVAGYDAVVARDDIDALYIPLPTGLHEEWVGKALATGKHLLVEKSLAMSHASAKPMVDAARKAERVLLENFLFPLHAQHAWVREQLEKDAIGRLHLFRATFGFPPRPENDIRYQPELGGGALLDAGAYVVKAAELFLGHEVEPVSATLVYDKALGVDIHGHASLANPLGQCAQVSFGFDYFYQCRYELLGSKGKLSVERAFTPPPGFRSTACLEVQDHCHHFTLPADNHYAKMWRFFAERIRGPEDREPDYEALLRQAKRLETLRGMSPRP